MKYKLIGNNNFTGNIIEEIFKNRNINNYEKILNANQNDELDYNLLDNMDEAIECLIEHLNKNHNILVVIDSDVDGITSGTMFINYLNLVWDNPNISWVIHEKKQHGLSDIQVYGNIDLVIVPDAGSNNFIEHKKLKERGIDVICLDHHNCKKYSEDAIVVNNQLSKNYPNKQLSGVGVTYKFIQALDDILWKDYSSNFLDLVALGNIADSMDLTNTETRYYVKEGINCITNSFFLSLIDKQSFSLKDGVNITGIMFYIAPLINAMIRVGTYKEKEEMVRAFLGNNELITYKSKGKDKEDFFCNYVARNCVNTKSRQKRESEKIFNQIKEKIKIENLDKDNIIIIDASEWMNKENSGLTGLIATQIANEYHKPAILLHGKDILKGSARGYGDLFDFRGITEKTKLVEFAEGHSFAFGVEVKRNNLINFKKVLNKKLEKYIDEKTHIIDFILKNEDITSEFIEQIISLKDDYCKGIEEPLVCIEDLEANKEDIKLMGKNKNTIKITTNNIDYIKFFTNEDEYNKIICENKNDIIKFNIIGKASTNEFNGNITYQIIIEDYEII
ncbi:DHH family phosphoesterase [Clostridium sporogenes]|uniref:DHH family phosphoesterase n=1 Tax=Clostridium sporogenes TaxID=1509 RepID=UPI0013D5029A|nr:DHH family phosphoesterase [Clostridium sporogenes]NFH40830.1 single-stranded-DNA-specific exonuclease RecJ [Clostridium sporogenes]